MLRQDIEEIREAIRRGRFPNEAAVCQGIVLRILHALSWPIHDTRIVAPEYAVEGRRVDFALCHPAEKAIVFIEVKQVGQSDEAGERQLFEYAFHKGVPMAILTDGREWQFYLPAEQGKYEERRVYKLDIIEREIDETVTRLERYLQYQAVCSGAAIDAARADYKDVSRKRQMKEKLPEAWRKLVEEGDESLLELLADRVEELCGYRPDPDIVALFLRDSVQLKNSQPPESPIKPSRTPPQKGKQKTSFENQPSQSAHIGFVLRGRAYSARSARDVMVKVFGELADQDPTFLDRFAALPKHGRTRRYVSRKRDELYPGRPDLVRDLSHEIRPGWWIGVNLGRNAIERILKMACDVAALKWNKDLTVNLDLE